jgi:Cu-processing system permease protein
MKIISEIARVTFKGGLRDKVFVTLLVISILCFIILIPAVSTMSMRQFRETAVSFSLSVLSFISLALTVFLGVTLFYRDIERRYAHSVLALPVSKEAYVLGKFVGLSSIIATGIVILSVFSVAGVTIASGLYPSTIPILWENFAAAVFFEFISFTILAGIAILFSSLSTNIFLPLFATLGFYVIGNITQTVLDYMNGPYGKKLPAFSIYLSRAAYYIFPNLSALDLKFYAIYSLPLSAMHLATLLAYSLLYLIMVLGLALLMFRRRELL